MINVRRASVEDLPALARIHRQAFFAAMPAMPVLHTPAEDLAFYRECVFPTAEIWLAESSAQPLGFIAFRPGWIEHCYIAPAAQRRGLGAQLLQHAQATNHSLQLWTFQCNQPARRFYEKHGFVVQTMTDGATNEERQPDVLYAWTRSSDRKTIARP